jgi:hypothetical protein
LLASEKSMTYPNEQEYKLIVVGNNVTEKVNALKERMGKDHPIPDLQMTYSIDIKPEVWVETIKKLDKSAAVILTGKADGLGYKVTDMPTADIRGKIPGEKFSGSIGTTTKYSVAYLRKMSMFPKLWYHLKVRFAKDYPLKLEYTGWAGSITYVLAPRVDND